MKKANERPPRKALPANFRPEWSVARRVTAKDSWVSLAREIGIDPRKLIAYNFHTIVPEEVNWYLRRNVGCREGDGKNYRFSDGLNPGVVYLPSPSVIRVDYTIPDLFDPIAQPSNMTCWAAVGAMMYSWHKQASVGIADALAVAGPKWLARFAANQGLPLAEQPEFAAALGMSTEPLTCAMPLHWQNLLKAYGPIAVVTANPTHARIVVGIFGNGAENGTMIDLIDPSGAQHYSLDYGVFTTKFQGLGPSASTQIWHY